MDMQDYLKNLGIPPSYNVFFQYNAKQYLEKVKNLLEEKGIILIDIKNGLKEYPEFEKYYNSLVEDNIKKLFKKLDGGYLLYIPKNIHVEFPIEACFIIEEYAQFIHNLIILDKKSSLKFYTGCLGESRGSHIAISEIILKQNSKLDYIMVHKWEEKFNIKPFTRILLEESSQMNNFYINVNGKGYLTMIPEAKLEENAKILSQNLILLNNGKYTLGFKAILEGKSSSAKLSTKAIIKEGKLKNILKIHTKAEGTKGHSSCDSIILGKGSVETHPIIESETKQSELTHEASIGKISEEILYYLMSKGLDEEQAKELYIREFLLKDLPELDERLKFIIKSQILKIKGI